MRETSCCLCQRITNSILLKAFISTSRYPDDLLNIDNNFFDSMVQFIYPSELQLNNTNVSGTTGSQHCGVIRVFCLYTHLSLHCGRVLLCDMLVSNPFVTPIHYGTTCVNRVIFCRMAACMF